MYNTSDSDLEIELYDDVDDTIHSFKIKLINFKRELNFLRSQCDQYDIRCWFDERLKLGSVNGSKNKIVCVVPKEEHYQIDYADSAEFAATVAIPNELSLGSDTIVKVSPNKTLVSSAGNSFEIDSTLNSAYVINGNWSGSGFNNYDIKFNLECNKLFDFMKEFKNSQDWDNYHYDDYVIQFIILENNICLKIIDSFGEETFNNINSISSYKTNFKIRNKEKNMENKFSYLFIDIYEIIKSNLIKNKNATICLHKDMPLIMKVDLESCTLCAAILPD